MTPATSTSPSKWGLPRFSRPAQGALFLAAALWLTGCGGGGGGGGSTDTPPVATPATVSSTAVGTARIGKPVVLTVNGSNLDKGLTVASAGCTGVALSTTAPNVSSASTAYYTCTAASAGSQQFTVTRTSDATLLSTVPYTVVVAQVTGTPTTSTARFGQSLLLTISGSDLDLGLSVTSAGCNNIALSTAAPNLSTASTAYYTCTPTAAGAQQFTVARASDSAVLSTVPFTVAVAQVTGTPTTSAALLGQGVVLTINGTDLDLGLNVTSAGCSNIALSTTAPNVSTATTAYYTCIATTAGAQQFTVARASDSAVLSLVPYTVTVAVAQLGDPAANTTSTPQYSQPLVLSVVGTNLDLGLTVTSPGCSNAALSTTAPYVSTATTAYFTCKVIAVGSQQLSVKRNSDNAVLATVPFTVPLPQVTLTFSNGPTGTVAGNLVITLEAARAPITVDNFLAYVSSGFYVGTVIHRNSPGFVLQGGGYAGPLSPTVAKSTKPTNPSIVLEDNVGLTNAKWTLAMARTSAPDSATSQYFINLADNNVPGAVNLDKTATSRGYAVFGTITTGTDVVTAMAAAPCVDSIYTALPECLPVPNLTITSAVQTR